MPFRNTETSYGSVAKFFHWLIFFILLGQITFGYFLEDLTKEIQPFAYNTHKLVGLTVLVLMLLRLMWALTNAKPRLPFITPMWQKIAEKIVHVSLYAVVIAMPIVGLVGSCAAGRVPHIGEYQITIPGVPLDKALAEQMFDIHNALAIVLITLVSVHALAALYHHFIKRDDVLRRMMPHCNRR